MLNGGVSGLKNLSQAKQLFIFGCFFILFFTASCVQHSKQQLMFEGIQLTDDPWGHCLHHSQCFSPDDQWIVYDTRNHDTLISHTGSIEIVHVDQGNTKQIYQTQNQTQYGPGVGAATFSPVENKVIFIHGIRNANQHKPYSISRRTGVSIDIEKPMQAIYMDARDIVPPFTAGALRGGTHAHSWSGDGKWISFTYNDYVIDQLHKSGYDIQDMRTVGIMIPAQPVDVESDDSLENFSGERFAVVAAQVTDSPAWGSDQIDKAYDEGWIGVDGYQKKDGSWQKRAIAFQGDLLNAQGAKHTEVFVLDLPEDPTEARPGKPLQGTTLTFPNVPKGFTQRRITFTEKGILGPRHWLRSTADGTLIGFLSEDDHGEIQIYGVSPNGGKISQLTNNPFSIQGPFNFSPDGKSLAYRADNSIFITEISTNTTVRLTEIVKDEEAPVGGVVWSNGGKMLAYNCSVQASDGNRYLQIFVLKLKS